MRDRGGCNLYVPCGVISRVFKGTNARGAEPAKDGSDITAAITSVIASSNLIITKRFPLLIAGFVSF